MADRFELETDITNLHNIADDIDLVVEGILEHDMATDDIANALLGISTLARLHRHMALRQVLDDAVCSLGALAHGVDQRQRTQHAVAAGKHAGTRGLQRVGIGLDAALAVDGDAVVRAEGATVDLLADGGDQVVARHDTLAAGDAFDLAAPA